MKKVISYLCFFFIVTSISAQNFELYVGMNQNKFFDRQKEGGHFYSRYSPGNGYSIGLSVSDLKINSTHIRISLLMDTYSGTFFTQDGGQGATNTTSAEVEKTTLGLCIAPLNFTLFKKIKFDVGGELSYEFNDKVNGYKSSWMITGTSSKIILGNNSAIIKKGIVFGISGRISYDIKINQDWIVKPQYNLYLGLTDEFNNTEAAIKSLRNNLGIGIVMRIK